MREWFMRKIDKANATDGFPDKPGGDHGPILSEAARLLLLLDGIKLIGTGNGAGALGSVVGLHYFSERPDLHFPMKLAAVFFVVGLLVFALAVAGYVFGLIVTTQFVDYHAPFTDTPLKTLNKGIDGLIVLALSLGGAVLSWGCFLIGTAIALYALVRLA